MNEYEQIIQHLRRIEDKMDTTSYKVAHIETLQSQELKKVADHESRLRLSESALTKVAVFFSVISLIFGSITAAVANKLFNG